jgi:hypothetical protein
VGAGVPAVDLLADEGPAIAVVRVELDEEEFFLPGPLLLVDAAPQVVVVAFAALLAVPGGNPELFMHHP